jgi:vitamin B12 transporter
VVVTANRVPVPLAEVTSSVTVLDARELREQGMTHVLDALRRLTGLTVARSGSFGAQASVFARGGESDFTKVLVDGVPMNDPGGAVDLGALTLDEVERIEIVRGPASVVHGSDAVSAVIHVVTRRAGAHPEARLEVGRASYGGSVLDAGGAAAAGPLSGTGGVARHASRGTLPLNNRYGNTVASARGAYTGATVAALAIRHGASDFHYPTDGAGRVADRNARRLERRTSAGLEASRPLGGRVTARLAASWLSVSGRTIDPPDGPGDTLGLISYRSHGRVRRGEVTSLMQWQATPRHQLVLGVEYAAERQRLADSSNYDATLNRFAAGRHTTGAFVQSLGGGARWSYALGARLDRNDVFGTFRTARATGAVEVAPGLRVRAGAGTAFKAPTFFEQFSTAFSVGNPALRPERARSWEVAVEHRRNRVQASATWFDQRFRDLVQYTWTSPTDPSYYNVAAARARGAELEAQVSAGAATALRASGTFLHTRVDAAGFDEGEGATFVRGARLLRRPSTTFALGATTRVSSRLTVDVQGTRVGARDDRDFGVYPARPVTLRPHMRVDASAQVRLSDPRASAGVTLVVRADNALGARYEEIASFAAPGRTLFAGLRAQWER